MKHTDYSNIHSSLQDNLTSILNEYSPDCLIYWMKQGDSSFVNRAATIGADKLRCMVQLGHYDFGNFITFAHEFAHLQGCSHEDGNESPNPVTFTYLDKNTYYDFYKAIMKTSNTKSVADNTSITGVWKFSSPNQKIYSSDNLTVDCSRHVPLSSGGTKSTDYQCRFSQNLAWVTTVQLIALVKLRHP